MKSILTRCGYRCDLCLAYKPNVAGNPANQQKLSDGWQKHFGFRMLPAQICCDGCMNVLNSEKLTKEESNQLITQHQTQLRLTPKQVKRLSGKRYLVLIEVENVTEIPPFQIDKSDYGNMDDWLPVSNIESVRA